MRGNSITGGASNSVNPLILNYMRREIYENDFHTLDGREWLNDRVINFYLKYIELNTLDDEQRQKAFFFDTFFFPETEREKNQACDVNLFDKDFIVVPINKDKRHWYLAIICFPAHGNTS